MFEYDGNEIVYVNNGIIGRIKFYINGCEEASSWAVLPDFAASITSRYGGHSYKVRSKITNLVTMGQNATLSVDGKDIESRFDPRLAALDLKQLGYFFGGMVLLAVTIGFVPSIII